MAPTASPELWHAPAFQPIVSRTPYDRGIVATVQVDSSKSLTNRHLLLAALADGPSTIDNVLQSRDSYLMMEALKRLGTKIDLLDDATNRYRITPLGYSPGVTGTFTSKQLRRATDLKQRSINCGLAGTVMRFVPPLAALSLGTFTFDGDPQARTRPMRTIIHAIKNLGINIDASHDGFLPFVIHGKGQITGGQLTIDASASSQFVSALLLVGAFFDKGLHLIHQGTHVPSIPHIEMTIQTLHEWGIKVDRPRNGEWIIAPLGTYVPAETSGSGGHLQEIRARHVAIEQDLSNIGPFLAAAQITGGTIQVPDWPEKTTQVGAQWCTILQNFGMEISRADSHAHRDPARPKTTTVIFNAPRNYQGCDLDLSEAGELAPTIAAIALFASTPSRLSGIAHLRGHETDRLAALTREFTKLGAVIRETGDGLEITPPAVTGKALHAPQDCFRTYADHRMATTAAIIGLRIPGIMVEDIACTQKTLPDFPGLWETMLRDSNDDPWPTHGSTSSFSACTTEEHP